MEILKKYIKNKQSPYRNKTPIQKFEKCEDYYKKKVKKIKKMKTKTLIKSQIII